MRRAVSLLILLVPWLVVVGPAAWGDIPPQNVLVLYNPAWTDGTHSGSYLADYYAGQRGIPSSNVVGLTGLGVGEEISATDYLNVIWPQVKSALDIQNIDVIVTTKGLPLRIRNDLTNPAGPPTWQYTYTDAAGIARTFYNDTWKRYSSLESELTRIDTIGIRNGPDWLNTALLQMGDQTWWDGNARAPNPAGNPYYQSAASFSRANPALGGMRLTARLDGFAVVDVTASIQKAQNAFLIPNSSPDSSYVVMDDDPTASVDRMVQLKDNVLIPRSQKYVYDNTSAPVTTAPGPVMGYVSHGIHGGGLNPGYITNQLSFTLANGAVFHTHESYNAYSFQPGGNVAGQGLVAEWLAKGGTAGVGNVQEPQNGTENVANEDQMFKMLLDGRTWGEAAWSSLQQLSYVNTVVGDPLMVWKKALAGDANLDGLVSEDDLVTVLANYNQTGTAWSQGDFDGDGTVDSGDMAKVLANFGQYALNPTRNTMSQGGLDARATHVLSAAGITAVPEPSSLVLLAAGLPGLVCYARRKRKYPGNAA